MRSVAPRADRSPWRAGAAAIAVTCVLHGAPAHAHGQLGPAVAIGRAIGVTNITFTVYDLGVLVDGPSTAWLVAEAALATAETAVLTIGAIAFPDLDESPVFVGLTAWGTQLAVYGAHGLASDGLPPEQLYALSWAHGVNAAFTAAALGRAPEASSQRAASCVRN